MLRKLWDFETSNCMTDFGSEYFRSVVRVTMATTSPL
jgi:hypothetical protein